ncbi:DUF4132 domain-containing protein [Acidovorax sp. NCPPB 3859]|nr:MULTISPECIES: DUF4132 domain-containing protein [unclassified Acidovorax]MDA8448346.1 DUF4132 domain-containing protein [Acidovorax sp. GBBC 3297]MDA8457687.1 DUF4132 domain-containing protein [Acidovorax sp. GBBC 3333]MDA8462789.1 DUF4132 domain-containing protein [Acidovorax sp. GBBC 3332]MDA8467757.1 DUF4132 domain-containing protein [Acidovorax sp. GBBC 3299]WCM77778.1 DUF4132 domain-containing protein [Acidovorax sp. GBBC 712]
MRRFELIEGSSSKFWEVEQAGSDLNIRWGRIGTAGQSQTKPFADTAKATAAMARLVTEKTGKGYAEVGVAPGAAIGASPAPAPAKPAPAKPPSPGPLPGDTPDTASAASAKGTAAAPVEGLDAQCERAVAATWAQIAEGSLKVDDVLSAAVLKRQHGVSDQGAGMAFEQLKSEGLLQGWGTTAQVSKRAQERARALIADAAARAARAASTAETPAASVAATGDGAMPAPPWLAHGDPVRLSPQMEREAYATRRFPPQVQTVPLAQAWQRARGALDVQLDLPGTDAALRDVLQRMSDRLARPDPQPDAEADAVLLALALSMSGYHGENAGGAAVVDYLVAQYGLPGAVDILIAAQRIKVTGVYDSQAQQRRLQLSGAVTHPMSNGWRGPLGQGEETFRNYLAAAPQTEWEACADRIEAALPSLHPSRQPVMALLLPDRPALSDALAHRLATEKETPETAHWLLLTAQDPAALAIAARTRLSYSSGFWGHGRMVATAVRERGSAAVAVLERGAADEAAGEALAAIGTPEAVLALAKVASSSKGALARLSLAVDRWPLAGITALSRLVAADGKDAGLLTPTLSRLLRAHGDSMPLMRPWLDTAAQGAVDRQLALLSGPAEVAGPDDLPDVLARPPWLAKAARKAVAVLSLEPLPLAPVEQWAPSAREEARRLNSWQMARYAKAAQDVAELLDLLGFGKRRHQQQYGPMRADAERALLARDARALVAAWRAMVAERQYERYDWYSFDATAAAQLPPEMAVPFWNAVAGETEGGDIGYAIATLGLPALPALAAMVRLKPTENLAWAMHYGAVEIAPAAARAFAKLKTARAIGRAWLLQYPEHAACALIAPALGKAGEARDCAGAALRLLRAQGHEAVLLDVAARYGDDAVLQALRAVLDESPLDRFPTKRAKLPEFWQPRGWRRPVLRSGTGQGKALPDEALDALGQMLTFPTSEEVYAGIALVREACTPDSLADFAWDAFSAWLEAGGPSKEGWALTALGLLGTDDTARRLTPFIRAWPGESAHARAVTGLDVLAQIGTDVALMLLNGIAQKIKFKGLQDKAREKIAAIAEARGLTPEELEDRLAPDLGLDAQGTLRLDFGTRAFKVGFDEALKPYVREISADGGDGARLPDLPKPKKTDDPALSQEAVERFKLLKKDARTIASQQLLRLEVAMCARRRWTPEVFRTFLAGHPLVRHIVQRLVWGVYEVEDGGSYGGRLAACFRVAEDGSATTAEDDPFDIPEGAQVRIGVPHALEITPADAAAFGQVFADYELLQPFPQIGRDTYTLTEAEKADIKLSRWAKAKVPTGRVLGLVNKGWRRGQAQDAGCIWYFTKPLGADRVIELHLDPGIIVGMVDEYPEQELGDVQVGKPTAWGEMQNAEPIGRLDPISASELVRDMEGLRA